MPLMGVPVPALALAGLTLELSRPAQDEPVLLGATKRARLERIVSAQLGELRHTCAHTHKFERRRQV